MNAALRSSRALVLCALASLLALGCEEKKKEEAVTDAGADQGPQKPVLGGKLGAVVKAAESAQAGSPAAKSADGPPENGVFAAGMGDKAHPPGAPAKVEVVSTGKDPAYTFALTPSAEQKEVASITVRLQGGAIPVEYGLLVKADKPKDDKAKDDKSAPVAGGTRVVAKVAVVSYPPQVPRDLGDKLGKLKGSEVRYTLSAAGGATDLAYGMSKDADPGLGEAVVKGLVDAIAIATPPLPPKPVGVGGFWMVTDRSSTFGVEVVRYRVYTVDKIEGGVVSLTVQVRQYAAKDEADLGALANGQKMAVLRFESSGTSKIDWTPTALLPLRAETSLKTGVAGNVGGASGQQAALQAEVVGRFAADTGDKKK